MFTPSLWRMKRLADSVPEMVRLQWEMNRVFSNVGQSTTQDYPAINVWEKNDSIIVTTELPGMEPEKTDISKPDPIFSLSMVSNSLRLKRVWRRARGVRRKE